jgi:hypothetical protein
MKPLLSPYRSLVQESETSDKYGSENRLPVDGKSVMATISHFERQVSEPHLERFLYVSLIFVKFEDFYNNHVEHIIHNADP